MCLVGSQNLHMLEVLLIALACEVNEAEVLLLRNVQYLYEVTCEEDMQRAENSLLAAFLGLVLLDEVAEPYILLL